jgi:hypothetical protein
VTLFGCGFTCAGITAGKHAHTQLSPNLTHIRNIPAWNIALLAEGDDFDIGDSPSRPTSAAHVSHAASVRSNNKRSRTCPERGEWSEFLAETQQTMREMREQRNNAVVAHHHYPPSLNSSPETAVLGVEQKRAADLASMKDQMKSLVEMRDMAPSDQQATFAECIATLAEKVRLVTCDVWSVAGDVPCVTYGSHTEQARTAPCQPTSSVTDRHGRQ